MFVKKFLFLIVAFLLIAPTLSITPTLFAAESESESEPISVDAQQDLEETVKSMLPPHVACAVLVVGKDEEGKEVVFKHVYGMRTLRDDAVETLPATTDTSFRLGTLTFPFTATAILRLADEGVLSLDDPIAKWLPEVPQSCREITVQQLLDRTAGVIGHPLRLNCQSHSSFNDYNLYEAFIASEGTEFETGTRGGDGTIPFTLLGMIAERAANQPFETLLRQRVLRACGMKKSEVLVEGLNIVPHRAVGYRPAEEWEYARQAAELRKRFPNTPDITDLLEEVQQRRKFPKNVLETAKEREVNPSIWRESDHGPFSRLRGSCALYASLDDLHCWVSTLRNRTTPLSNESWKLFLDPQSTPEASSYNGRMGRRYSCGWVVDEQLGEPRYSSPGWTLSFLQTFQWLPQSDRAVVVLMNNLAGHNLSNEKWGDRATEELGERLMNEVLGEK